MAAFVIYRFSCSCARFRHLPLQRHNIWRNFEASGLASSLFSYLSRVFIYMPCWFDHVVNNIDEAVQLANEWLSQGTHTWFRGQADVEWPLISAAARRARRERRARRMRLARRAGDEGVLQEIEECMPYFCRWLRTIPQLQHLLLEEHVHEVFAVLQHHEVPTNYVDCTTRPERKQPLHRLLGHAVI